MKFAKYLDDNLVPEWRVKYLDYKQGKKKLKVVGRAVKNAEVASSSNVTSTNPTPATTSGLNARQNTNSSQTSTHKQTHLRENTVASPTEGTSPKDIHGFAPARSPNSGRSPKDRNNAFLEPGNTNGRVNVNKNDKSNSERHYIASPAHSPRAYGTIPEEESDGEHNVKAPPNLELPPPAKSQSEPHAPHARSSNEPSTRFEESNPRRERSRSNASSTRSKHPVHQTDDNLIKRVFHKLSPHNQPKRTNSFNISNTSTYLEMTEDSQREFFKFLDSEIAKIEEFYKSKEDEAKERYEILNLQSRLMDQYRTKAKEDPDEETLIHMDGHKWRNPTTLVTDVLNRNVGGILGRRPDNFDPTSSVAKLAAAATDALAPNLTSKAIDHGGKDYSPKQEKHQISHRTAKHKIKHAIVEYYRGLELIKSYCLLNREAFRKIMKKYDKTAHQKIASTYMKEKIDPTAFSSSEEVHVLITRTENMFAKYFEKGRRKHAIERLRTKEHKKEVYGAMFRCGVYLGVGLPLLVQSLVLARTNPTHYGMKHPDETSYLLQIWAGFGLPILFTMLFCLCCRAWVKAKINYVFIFEFDTRNNMDWRQLLEIPCTIFFIQAILMFFCFSNFWGDGFDRIWFPVIFIGVALCLILCPFRVFYLEGRTWFLKSLYRLIWAGLYPVEFRDFWLGDVFCSLTYSMGNLPLFVCLYSQHWHDAPTCNSSHSRVLGFFSCLPAVWRLLQCLRRYRDTRKWFPHLANGGKYTCTILFYMSLSLYRIDRLQSLKSLFIFFALINALYTSTWDLLMDWSLLDWYAPHKLLRTELAFKRPWVYYLAMIIDPIIRNNWIFYALFVDQLQHSAALSFFVSLTEIFRRWMWTFFRMENEHTSNVGKFRAYRDDIPLPYDIPQSELSRKSSIMSTGPTENDQNKNTSAKDDDQSPESPTAEDDPESGDPKTVRSQRSSGALNRAFTLVKTAHKFDFERRKPSQSKPTRPNGLRQTLSNLTIGGQSGDEEDEISTDDEDHEEERRRLVDAGADNEAISIVNDHVDDMAGLRRRTSRIEEPMNRDRHVEQQQARERDFAAEGSTSRGRKQDKDDERQA